MASIDLVDKTHRRRPASTKRPNAASPDASGMRLLLGYAAGATIFVVTWLSLLGPVAPVLLMAATAGGAVLMPQQTAINLARCWPILIVGALAMVSALWSTDPAISLRYGTQLAITLVSAIVLATILRPRELLRVVFVGCFFVLVLCIISGKQGGSPYGPVLIGVLGSKNEMGQLCQLTICSAVAVAMSPLEPRALRSIAWPAGALAVWILIYTFATGALITTFLFFAVAALLFVASKLPAGSKFLLAGLVTMFAVPLWLIREDINRFYEWVLVEVLHKDVGLTGRDYLWAHADRLISDMPLLGHGYRSTWLGSSAETLGLLRWAGLESGAGFNFHDTYREWAVDFGYLGAAIVIICLASGMLQLLFRAAGPRTTGPVIFLAATVCVLVARAKVETIFGPFSSSSIVIGVTAASGFIYRRPAAALGAAINRRSSPTRPALDNRSGRSTKSRQGVKRARSRSRA